MPHKINAMTNHMLEKQHSAYASVADRDTCKVMAGFKLDEAYFVPRCDIELPQSLDFYISCLLPKLFEYRIQSLSERGDDSTCCKNWLYHLVPWFILVLVQDGIYFIEDFKEHKLSIYLKVSVCDDVVSKIIYLTN